MNNPQILAKAQKLADLDDTCTDAVLILANCMLKEASPSTGKRLFILFNDMYQTCMMTSST